MKKNKDLRPTLNKLFDPICDPVPKSYKEVWGKDAKKVYYESESREHRWYKNAHYYQILFRSLLGFEFGRFLGGLLGELLISLMLR